MAVREGEIARFGVHEMTLTQEVEALAVDLQPVDPCVQILDRRIRSMELRLRPRKPGDAYVPEGHTQPRRLKDLMIARRIPASQRACWPLLVIAETNQIVCGPRLPVNREFTPSSVGGGHVRVSWKKAGASLD